MKWSLQDKILIVELFFREQSFVGAQRAYRRERRCKVAPPKGVIRRLVDRFRSRGSILAGHRGHRSRAVREHAVPLVRKCVGDEISASVRRISRATHVPQTTVHRVLHADLGLYPYKLQVTQRLYRGDKAKRWQFCKWLLETCDKDSAFLTSLLMSDEAKFSLNGMVNKQNCRIWSSEQPHVMQQAVLYPPTITVWCAVSAGCVIGPFFFEEEGEPVTVTGVRYRSMITEFLLPELRRRRIPKSRVWMQQDGATPHVAKASIALLLDHFPGKLISKGAAVSWPPRSPDLTAPDFFLWGLLKEKVYATPVPDIRALKAKICNAVKQIPRSTLTQVFRESLTARCHECVRRHGSHLEDVIF